MTAQNKIAAFKMLYTVIWVLVASYYFSWGANEPTAIGPIDVSGWIPDGALVSALHPAAAEAAEAAEAE